MIEWVDTLDLQYPSSDGKPMAERTIQFRWIMTIRVGVERLFLDRPDVFVAGDLLWYPVEGHPEICQAPDVLWAEGRPQGDRRSYKQWQEGGVAPQVVFEVRSYTNTAAEMARKLLFYQEHGVQEYYDYDPDTNELSGYLRDGAALREVPEMNGFVSPRLGIRFDLSGPKLRIFGPDGRQFLSYEELLAERGQAEERLAETEKARADAERKAADETRAKVEAERKAADAERQKAAEAERAARLAQRLRDLGIDPDQV